MPNFIDLTGKVFGRLTVIRRLGLNRKGLVQWLCRCSCGNEKSISGKWLRNGKTRSCGCLQPGIAAANMKKMRSAKVLPEGEGIKRRIIQSYKSGAKNRNLIFDLDISTLDRLFKGRCAYCGCGPSNIRYLPSVSYPNQTFAFNGIDRVDNAKGYTADNCVSCCITCNGAKSSLSTEDFLRWLDRAHGYSHEHIDESLWPEETRDAW